MVLTFIILPEGRELLMVFSGELIAPVKAEGQKGGRVEGQRAEGREKKAERRRQRD